MNPGGGWVSRLCHEPGVSHQVLQQMLAPYLATGRLQIVLRHVPVEAHMAGDAIEAVTCVSVGTREEITVSAPFVLDASELGDMLPLCEAEFVVGAESAQDTDEPHAIDGPAEPQNVQALTWVFAMAHDEGSDRVLDEPEQYAGWRTFQPSFWPGPLIGSTDLNPVTNAPRRLPWVGDGSWFQYRQILDPMRFEPGRFPIPSPS